MKKSTHLRTRRYPNHISTEVYVGGIHRAWIQFEEGNMAVYLTGKEKIENHGTMLIIYYPHDE